MAETSCFGRGGGKPRVLSEQCSTCIGKPGNLRSGRLQDMVQEALRQGCQGIICHKTLNDGENPEYGGALCRWFYDTYGPQNNFIRVMWRLGGFDEMPLPAEEEGG